MILGTSAHGSTEKRRDLANHRGLDGHRLDSYNKTLAEICEILGAKKYMNQESAIKAVSEAKGKKGKKGLFEGTDCD